jgi:hypothetical protein
VGVLGEAHVLRAALIVSLVLSMPASADLWTSSPSESAARVEQEVRPAPTQRARSTEKGARDGDRQAPFTLTVLVDPTCPLSPAVLQDALAFARTHADVDVRVLIATRPARSRDGMRTLVAAAEAGLRVAWAPGAVRRLAPVALPAVYLEDHQGHGARATGRPPLEALWRAVAQGSRG